MEEVSFVDVYSKVKGSIDYNKVGMIVAHNGVVRGTSRDGKPVSRLHIEVDKERMDAVLAKMRKREGISAVEAHVRSGERLVGEDVMFVVIAGDFRENVFKAQKDTVNELKEVVVHKKEY